MISARQHQTLSRLASLVLGAALTFGAGAAAANGSPGSALHAPLAAVLSAHVVDGHVDSPSIATDARFRAYLDALRRTEAESIEDPRERLAFWINAYNALAIQGILDGRSPSSFFGRIGYFKTAVYDAGGRSMNLYDLEREVIIPMGEPRIHFAINCASASCPALRSEAYVPEQLEMQLEDATRRFINDPSLNRFDADARVASLSKIFDWFPEDFESAGGTVLDYVARYVADPALAAALREDGWTVRYLPYDWSLNGDAP